MQYDFDTVIDRRGKDAMAVDIPASGKGGHYLAHIQVAPGFDCIPMWIADINFATAPCIPKALAERSLHPLYGYFQETDAYYDAILNWQRDRHGVTGLTRECIGYENGVLGGIASALRAVCAPGEPVLVHSPTYVGFTHTLADNGWEAVLSPLKKDENGVWRMDFADMEQKLKARHIHAAVFCSPHNPAGRVWERWELEQMMDLFARYDVTVISDEIWSDLAPEALILATGSTPIVPPLPGIDGDNVVVVNNYYLEKDKVGDSVVVLGGGLAGCECAVHLGMEGKTVHLVEMRDQLAVDCNIRHRPILMQMVDKYTTVHLKHAGLRVTGEGLVCKDEAGKEVLIPGSTVICAVGQRSNRTAVDELRTCAPRVREIGDYVRVSNITNAVYQGYHAALDI